MKLVVVTGVESTGKSTLAQALAAHYQAPCVNEYAREFLEGLGRPYQEADLPSIARGQLNAQQAAAASRPPLLIADTDLSVIAIWGLFKYNRMPTGVAELLQHNLPQLYLLPHWDMHWQPDPFRENPDAASRQTLYTMYQQLLATTGVPVVQLQGNQQQQLQQALKAINQIT